MSENPDAPEIEMTVEVTYDLPIYTCVTVMAPAGDTLEAGRRAIATLHDKGWPAIGDGAKEDINGSSAEFVTAIALGSGNPNDAPIGAQLNVPAVLARPATILTSSSAEDLIAALEAKGIAVLATASLAGIAGDYDVTEDEVREKLPVLLKSIENSSIPDALGEIYFSVLNRSQ